VPQFREEIAVFVRFVCAASVTRHAANVAQRSLDVRRGRAPSRRSLGRRGRDLRGCAADGRQRKAKDQDTRTTAITSQQKGDLVRKSTEQQNRTAFSTIPL
jgi:hypothetical protein